MNKPLRLYKNTYRDETGQKKKAAGWAVDFTDHMEIRRRIPLGVTDKRAAEAMAGKIEGLINCRAAKLPMDRELQSWIEVIPSKLRDRLAAIGLIEAERAAGGKPLSGHLGDFRESLKNQGGTEKYSAKQYGRAKKLLTDCVIIYLSDVNPIKIERCLAEYKRQGISGKTCNYYLQALQQFFRWMIQNRIISENPIGCLKPMKCDPDEALKRRSLEICEIKALLAATEVAGERFGMTGHERALGIVTK